VVERAAIRGLLSGRLAVAGRAGYASTRAASRSFRAFTAQRANSSRRDSLAA